MLSRSAVRMLPFLLTLIAAGAPADVTILRDRYGVPHIYGDSEADAAYGLGIAQCEDNVANLLYGLHAAVGRLAEFYGPQHLEQDIEARTLGNAWYAERDWPKLDVRVRRIVQAYCDGVNEYLRTHRDELPFAAETITPVHILARNRQFGLLSAVNVSRTDAEASRFSGYHPLYNAQQVGEEAEKRIPPGKSNSWVLGPGRTAAGVPMLLIDPHWAIEGHLQLYEAHLSGGKLRCSGFFINGSPLPGVGLSPWAAWTVTAGGADSSDAFALRIHPQNPDRYEFDGRWLDMEARDEVIRVREAGGLREEKVRVRTTIHGPVLRTQGGTPYAAAFAGWDRADTIEQSYLMATARSTDEFKAAIAMDRLSYFNLMWATRDGNIGYVQTGEVPLRPPGFNWNAMVPGWTSAALYRGKVPFARLPQVENPPTGFIQNCNVAANVVTPGLTFTAADFPIGALFGHYGAYRARGQRATQLLGEVSQATLEVGQRIAFDTYVPPADLWVPIILRAHAEARDVGPLPGIANDSRVIQAIEILRQWDRHATRDSVGATLFRFWRFECHTMDSPVKRDGFTVPDTPQVRADALTALGRAVAEMQRRYGRIDVPWGQVKRLRRGGKEWPVSGDGLTRHGLDTLRATAGDELDDDHKILTRGGQSVTSLVLLTDPPVIHSVVAFGQSNKADSPHYDDQAPLYSDEQLREVPWTREQVESQARSRTDYRYTGPELR